MPRCSRALKDSLQERGVSGIPWRELQSVGYTCADQCGGRILNMGIYLCHRYYEYEIVTR